MSEEYRISMAWTYGTWRWLVGTTNARAVRTFSTPQAAEEHCAARNGYWRYAPCSAVRMPAEGTAHNQEISTPTIV